MRSQKQPAVQSLHDENIDLRGKQSTNAFTQAPGAPGHNTREVLGDVTQLKNENYHQKKPSASGVRATASLHNVATASSNTSKVQIFKQQYNHHQFKKPRLEKILLSQRKNRRQADDDEDTDEEDSLQEEILVEEDDDFDKENSRVSDLLNNNYHGNSDDILIRKHFDKLTESQTLLSPEIINNSDLIDELAFTNEDKENRLEPEDEAQLPEEKISKHQPMEPVWSKAIFNELQYVVRKYSRTNLDENDEDTFDVTMVAEYAPEIFNYMHELENRLVPDPNYMENQDELKWEMRAVLIDWVVQVHSRFNLLPETLYLTVNYIDRFLSKRKVSLSRFQLVGAVALFIAAKYEEINCPTVQEVAYMADNAYSIEDFLKAERFMIDVLEFDMGWPGPMSFLRRTSKADDYDYETRTLAKYFLEITIMDSKFVASQPSWLAAGAHYLARKILNKGDWTELHVFYSGYTESQLRPLAEVLLENCRFAETNHKAIFEKYQERRYRRSSAFVQEYMESME